MQNVYVKAWASLAAFALAVGAAVFWPAGTTQYWQGWLFLAVFLGASIATVVDLMMHDPALLSRRLKGGPTAEKQAAQRIIMIFTAFCYVSIFAISGFDRRFEWSAVPWPAVLSGDALVLIGFYLVSRVYRANTVASATIDVEQNQKVISTGPYAIVRHPMYAGTLVYLAGIPAALGSYWGFVPFIVFIPFLIWRLLDEEQLLSRALPGYEAYHAQVRWRLVPFLF
ncbi:MAG: isoprenylcysteine carboxylmethyltransferase family protein [Rhizomicrobium sp.]|jgi:protein-S-isoprenylcysteine O-methyltransferase Ste14